MRRAQGYMQVVDPDQPLLEWDTITCGHCSRIVCTKPGTAATVYLIQHRDGRWTDEPGAFCRVCMRPVCLRCHDLGRCRPLERWLAEVEARGAA